MRERQMRDVWYPINEYSMNLQQKAPSSALDITVCVNLSVSLVTVTFVSVSFCPVIDVRCSSDDVIFLFVVRLINNVCNE